MKKPKKIIREKGININSKTSWLRKAARAIIYKDGKLLMIHSNVLNDYTFPGGGLKPFETFRKALKRELKEELGANKVTNILPYYDILEIRNDQFRKNHNFKQYSKYYLCNVQSYTNTNKTEKELRLDMVSRWIKPIDAYNHNIKTMNEREHDKLLPIIVLQRANHILKLLIEEGY